MLFVKLLKCPLSKTLAKPCKKQERGDANTKFFHIKVNARKRKNFIEGLANG
jgi:hypothetical protein